MYITNCKKVKTMLACILFLMPSCGHKNTRVSARVETKISSTVPINERPRWENILKNVGEPNLIDSKKESYRFCYGGFQGHNIFMFTVTVDSVCILTSKYILDSASLYKPDARSEVLALSKDSSIKSYKQILAAAQINHIRSLLNGTYYYSIGAICPEGDGWIRDNMGHIFEFKTACCGSDSLNYHQIHFPDLNDGQFREVWRYIINISKLTMSDKQLRQYLENV